MPVYQNEKREKPKHEHYFVNGKCECGAEKITWEEFKRRKITWDAYLEKVRETEAFQIFQVCRAAFKDYTKTHAKESFDLVKECAQRAREIREERNWLPKPPFPDPMLEAQYGRLIVE
jgi:acetoin utilization deacetylase AcuC-like enzyme